MLWQNSGVNVCTHFWVFETPDGPTSKGKCKYCGLETEARNSITVKDSRHINLDSNRQRVRDNRVEDILSKKAKGDYVY